MSMSRYGVLLVTGSHSHQEIYAAAFAADPRCRMVAVADERDVSTQQHELNEMLARVYGIPYVPDLDLALRDAAVQIGSICAPPDRRARIAARCAAAGKHLYLDKPLAPRLEEADALVAAVRQAGVRSHMFSFVTQPWARTAKKVLQEGRLGRLRAIHAELFFAKGPAGTATLGTLRREEYPPERQQLETAKRELDNTGVYPVTLIRWLSGLRFRTVFGLTGNYFFREHQDQNVEDFGFLSCTLEDGTPVTVATGRCSWSSHPASGVHRLFLAGSERNLLLDVHRPRLEVYSDGAPWAPPPVHAADPMGFWNSTQEAVGLRPKETWVPIARAAPSDAAYFLDCLDAGRESEMSVPEAALATEVLLAGYKSAATGDVVSLPLPRGRAAEAGSAQPVRP
jgi:predicted dehydrogenase